MQNSGLHVLGAPFQKAGSRVGDFACNECLTLSIRHTSAYTKPSKGRRHIEIAKSAGRVGLARSQDLLPRGSGSGFFL